MAVTDLKQWAHRKRSREAFARVEAKMAELAAHDPVEAEYMTRQMLQVYQRLARGESGGSALARMRETVQRHLARKFVWQRSRRVEGR